MSYHGVRAAWALAAFAVMSCTVARAVPPFTVASGDWYQLSYPADTAGRSLRTLFGSALRPADYAHTWQVFTFDGRTQRYLDPGIDGALDEGQGFWLIQTTGTPVELGGADLPHAVGAPSRACAVPEGCRESSLAGPSTAVGWNLVGHPFEGPVDVTGLRVLTRASGSGCRPEGCSLADARTIVNPTLWSYDPGAGRYVDLAARTLRPWMGVWFALAPGAHGLRPVLLHPDPFCA